MKQNKYINYNEAVEFGNAMSEKNFFHHGVPGIDDKAPRYPPNEMKTEKGILVYRRNEKGNIVVFGYRHTPWIGEKKIRLVPFAERDEVESELSKILNEELLFYFRNP